MTNKLYDDSNWREEYKGYTRNKRYLELLENGPKSLSQAWLLGALHNEWKKHMTIQIGEKTMRRTFVITNVILNY